MFLFRTIMQHLEEEQNIFDEQIRLLEMKKEPSENYLKQLAERREAIYRDGFYRKIIRHNFIPKYYVFDEADSHVKNLNCLEIEELMKETGIPANDNATTTVSLLEDDNATTTTPVSLMEDFDGDSACRGVM